MKAAKITVGGDPYFLVLDGEGMFQIRVCLFCPLCVAARLNGRGRGLAELFVAPRDTSRLVGKLFRQAPAYPTAARL